MMTVSEALMEIRNYFDPYSTNKDNVIIVDGGNHYSGSVGYFLNNGAFDYLRQKTVLDCHHNVIVVNNVFAD